MARTEGNGEYVIIRAKDAGVHFGKLVYQDDRTVRLREALRMWEWRTAGGIALSGCAVYGIDTKGTKLDAQIEDIIILDACEVLFCTEDSAGTFLSAWANTD